MDFIHNSANRYVPGTTQALYSVRHYHTAPTSLMAAVGTTCCAVDNVLALRVVDDTPRCDSPTQPLGVVIKVDH